MSAKNPEHTLSLLVPSAIEDTQPLEFDDQHVISFGAIYRLNDATTLSAGYTHARQPVPLRNLQPLFAVLPETHYTLGFGRNLSDEWDLNIGAQYVARTEVSYSNPPMRISASPAAPAGISAGSAVTPVRRLQESDESRPRPLL